MAVTLLVFLAALGLRRMIRRAQLREWDRHLGFLAGAAKGFALAVVLTLGALAFSSELRERVRGTRTGDLMAQAVRALRPVLPDALDPWLRLLLEPPQRRNA
jgi:uncharacterized membrane protein required for colicin V production